VAITIQPSNTHSRKAPSFSSLSTLNLALWPLNSPKLPFGPKSSVTISGMVTTVFTTWAAFRDFLLDKLASGDTPTLRTYAKQGGRGE
jgi:hypothetical protein